MQRVQRQPLITAALFVSLVSIFLSLAVSFEWISLTEYQMDLILQATAILAPLVVAALAYRFVTPVINPRDNEGRSLVPKE